MKTFKFSVELDADEEEGNHSQWTMALAQLILDEMPVDRVNVCKVIESSYSVLDRNVVPDEQPE